MLAVPMAVHTTFTFTDTHFSSSFCRQTGCPSQTNLSMPWMHPFIHRLTYHRDGGRQVRRDRPGALPAQHLQLVEAGVEVGQASAPCEEGLLGTGVGLDGSQEVGEVRAFRHTDL